MPNPSILSIEQVVIRLREWATSRRPLRVIVRLEILDFSAFCVIDNADEDSFSMMIGEDPRNMFGVRTSGWKFAFGETLEDFAEELPVGGVVESAIVGTRAGSTLMLLALRKD